MKTTGAATIFRDKAFKTLQARVALVGHALHRTDDDRGESLYVVSRWGQTKAFNNLDDLAIWVGRITGGTR